MITYGRVFGFTGEQNNVGSAAALHLREASPLPSAHLEMVAPVLQVAQGWMHRIGLVESLDNRHFFALVNAISDAGGRFVTSESLRKINSEALTAYVRSRTGMTNAERHITSSNIPTHRVLVESLWSGVTTKVDNSLWLGMVGNAYSKAKEEGAELVTIGGLRYANEADFVRSRYGFNLEINSDRQHPIGLAPFSSLPPREVDSVVAYDGSNEQLAEKMAAVLVDANELGYLQERY